MAEFQADPLIDAGEAMQRVNVRVIETRAGALQLILEAAETAYLETYAAWRMATTSRDGLLAAHHRVRDYREKLHQVKKLMEELDCEGDRLLGCLHSLRP